MTKKIWQPAKGKPQRTLDVMAGIDTHAGRLQLEQRILYLFNEIRDESDSELPGVTGLMTGMRALDALAPGKPITLYINSVGGDVFAGLSLIQTMRDLNSPVHTVVMGLAASMAAYVAVAGARRYAYPTARYMLHRPKTWGIAGDHKDIDIEARELKLVNSYCDQLLVNFSKVKQEQIELLTAKDFWFGPKEALKFGILDETIIPRQGPQRWSPHSKKGLVKDGDNGI